jgi:serine/threonine-protein kinase
MSANFASVSEPAEVRPGTRLGRYEVLIGIAQGGMARVWAARQQGHRGFTKIVAIKTILPALTSDPSFEAMFLDEARVAAGVHHPNVCQIFDLGEEAGVLYLAMEWVNGESLARILKPPIKGDPKREAQRLNARIAARIVADAAAGLHAAHELADETGQQLEVVHRDVSPQNILVTLTGNVKVTDFGVAKALGSSHEATAAGQIKGKAAYMSPEQAAAGTVDRRSDIFALGIVLYEITTGKRPFHGENQIATLKLLLEGRFEPPGAIVPGYPRELEAIVMRAMAMDPSERFPSADRMKVALEEWLARSGPVVTETQVGALVRERVGEVVEERQSRIRERMKAPAFDPRASQPTFSPPGEASSSKISAPSAVSHVAPAGGVAVTPSGAMPSVSLPSIPIAMPQRTGPSPAMLGVVIGLAAFVVLALVGVGLFIAKRGEPDAPAAVAPPAEAPRIAPTPVATETPKPPPKLAKIKLIPLEPKQGVSFAVDGKPLAAGVLTIERPEPGKVKLLAAQAEGYQSDVFRIDDATPDELDILLLKKQNPDSPSSPSSPSGAGAPRDHGTAAPRDHGTAAPRDNGTAKKPSAIKPDIPDNPF